MSGSMPASCSASMTPMWDQPRADPLPSARPMRGRVITNLQAQKGAANFIATIHRAPERGSHMGGSATPPPLKEGQPHMAGVAPPPRRGGGWGGGRFNDVKRSNMPWQLAK